MTDFEKLCQTSIFMEEKIFSRASEKTKSKLRENWSGNKNPQVAVTVAALSKEVNYFRGLVRNRILSEHKEVFINRCPDCNKVVKIPMAKMCLWCGQSWRV